MEEKKDMNQSPSFPEECAVCCDGLAELPVSVLANGKSQVCRHFFHTECVRSIRNCGHSKCPICRVSFDNDLALPNIQQNPRAWFQFVDVENHGELSLQRILEVLRASILVDHKKLESKLPTEFRLWDTNNDGRLSYDEMMAPKTGLVAWARKFVARQGDWSDMPDINKDSGAWFRYWDEDGNGVLGKEEVIRALTKTFIKSAQIPLGRSVELREIVQTLWVVFDADGSGGIDAEEFCKTDGLYETIIANF